jgi:outer membrane protein
MAQGPASLPIGVVDMRRVLREYQTYVRENEEFKRFVARKREELRARVSVRLLSQEERDEYLRLFQKGPQATPEERQRMRALEEKNTQLERRIEELSQKPDLSEEEKQELERLRKLELEAQARLEQLRREYERQLNERDTEISRKLEQNIRNTISFIAGRKGLSMVLDYSAVLFGGVDITNEVLAELNKEGSS